jgi:hypothetical protein
MMADQDIVSTVNIEFRKAPTYTIVPATGTWGTKTADGRILCNFLVESEEPPESLVLGVSRTGQAVSEVKRNFKGDKPAFIKEFMVGVLMTPEAARGIGKWLIEVGQEQHQADIPIHTLQTEGFNDEENSDE